MRKLIYLDLALQYPSNPIHISEQYQHTCYFKLQRYKHQLHFEELLLRYMLAMNIEKFMFDNSKLNELDGEFTFINKVRLQR